MMNDETVIIAETENKPPEKRVWGAWATLGFGAVILVVFFVVQVLVILVAGAVGVFTQLQQTSTTADFQTITQRVSDIFNANLGLLQSVATIVSGIIGTGLIILFIKARRRAGIAEYLGLKKLNYKTALLAIAVVIVFLALSSLMYYVLGKSTAEGIMNDIYNTSIWPPLFWIAVVIFAPLFEEAFFRGFVFEGFRRSPLGLTGAVLLTALGWAVMHSLQYNIYSIIWIFMLGIAMGIVRARTGSIWATFIMHAVVNLAATVEMALKLSIFVR
jgi:uncharacterized protein